MELSSLFSTNSIYSTSGVSSISSTTSTTASETDNSQASTSANYDTVSFSLANSGVVSAHRSSGESLMDMSTDDFRDHLQDIVDEMSASGIDTSSYDISSLSDEELESLKTSMHEGAKKGPPPPKGYEMGAEMTASATSSSDDLTQMLLDALSESDEEEENYYQISQSLLEALQSDNNIDETGELASFIAMNM